MKEMSHKPFSSFMKQLYKLFLVLLKHSEMKKVTDLRSRIHPTASVLTDSPPPSFQPSTINGITIELLPIFKFLRILGRCPLLFEVCKDWQGFRTVRYRFQASRQPHFVASAFAAVFVSICCVLSTIHSFSKTDVFGELYVNL
jgi:hypothetical protein